jgi:hypothetical protein
MMSNTIPATSPELAYGMALLEVQQTNRRTNATLVDALHETKKAQLVVGTIFDGLVNAEKKTQRNLAYVNGVMGAVSLASAGAGVAGASSPTPPPAPEAPEAQLSPPPETVDTTEPEVEAKTEDARPTETEEPSVLELTKEALSLELQRRGEVSRQAEALLQQAAETQEATAESLGSTRDLLRSQDQADRELLGQIAKLGMLRFTG